MTKKILVYIILIACIAVAVWFGYDKFQKAENGSDGLDSIVTPTETPNESPNMTNQPANPNPTPAQPEGQPVQHPSGLVYQDVKVGTGPAVENGDVLKVHYTGMFEDGKVFDSSRGGDPIEFTVGAGGLIQGWEIGVIGMKQGGVRRLVIPPDLGYGPNDYGPIPGNSTLYFELELVSVTKK